MKSLALPGSARPTISSRTLVWGVIALLLGTLAGLLPVKVTVGLFAVLVLGLALLIEPALGLVFMLSVAPLKTLIATETSLAFPLDIGQISLCLVVGIWALWRVTWHAHEPLPQTRVYGSLLGIMLAFSPSLFGAVSTGAWVNEVFKWVEMLLLVMIVVDLARERRWTWIASGVVMAAAWQAVIGLYEFRGGSGAPHLWIMEYRYFRAFGTFGQPNPFSAFMGLSLPLALGMAWGYLELAVTRWRAERLRWRWPGVLAAWYAGIALILLAALLASWGRGAWLGFGMASAVMVCFAPRNRLHGIVLMAVGVILAGSLWFVGLVPAGVEQRVQNTVNEFVGFGDMRGVPVSNENFAVVERLAHWQAAANMARDRFWFGVGLGNYEIAYADYRIPSWPHALGHAHNDYLNFLAETGIIGLVGYLIGWALIVMWTLQSLRLPDPVLRGIVLGLVGTWTHLAVHSIVDKLYVNNLFLHIGVMLGLLAVAINHDQELVGKSRNDDII